MKVVSLSMSPIQVNVFIYGFGKLISDGVVQASYDVFFLEWFVWPYYNGLLIGPVNLDIFIVSFT